MSIKESAFVEQVDEELRGISLAEINADARQVQLLAALERYNKDRPGEDIVDVSGDGGKYYEITTTDFPKWIEGFSRVILIEYPAPTIADDDPPKVLESDDWIDNYRDPTKRYLYLTRYSPSSSETMRITYTFPHTFSAPTGEEIEVEVPAQDFYAVCALAASYCCGALAAKYGQSKDSGIGADAVRYGTKSGRYERRAVKFLAKYNHHMGFGKTGLKGESVIHEWDLRRPAMCPRRRRRIR